MGSVSRRQKRRLYDPETERNYWRHVFFEESMTRPTARSGYCGHLEPLFQGLVQSLAADPNYPRVQAAWVCQDESLARLESCVELLCAYDGFRSVDSVEGRMLAKVEAFCKETLRSQQSDQTPWWLFNHVSMTLVFGATPIVPLSQLRLSDGAPSNLDIPVLLPSVPNAPIPLRPAMNLDDEDCEQQLQRDVPVVTGSLSLELAPGQDLDEWRKDVRARVEREMDRMQAEAETTFHHMNPSTVKRWHDDAKDLAALCVDGWPPIGEAHKKRLMRFAAFIGIDYPGQKLTPRAA